MLREVTPVTLEKNAPKLGVEGKKGGKKQIKDAEINREQGLMYISRSFS